MSWAVDDLGSAPGFLRWAVTGVVVAALHLLLPILLMTRTPIMEAEGGSPVVLLDFAPTPTAPRQLDPNSDTQPAPEEASLESHKTVDVERPQQDQPKVPQAEQQSEIQQKVEELAKPDQQQPTPESVAKTAAVAPASPLDAQRPAGPSPGETDAQTARQLAAWQRSLLVRLEKVKRYPADARGIQGIVRVAFTIDEKGHLLSGTVVESSGSAILDAEALAMLRRAEPFPLPPPGLSGAQLSFQVPVRFVRNR